MGCALALPVLASLAAAATADLQLDFAAQGRATRIAPDEFAAYTREALLARPGATLGLEAVPVRVAARYAATIWTSDVDASGSPLVTQDGQLRVEARHGRPWRASALVSAARGWTDPLADPVLALSTQGPTPSPALEPVEFEALRAALDASVPLDLRTTVAAEGSAWRSGGAHAADRAVLPVQDGVATGVAVDHALSLRSALRLAAAASAIRTDLVERQEDSRRLSASARWRVQVTRTLATWAGAGAIAASRDLADGSTDRWARPTGEIGLAYTAVRGGAELSAEYAAFTHRVTGEVVLMYQGAGSIWWRESQRLSFRASASGGSTASGDTARAALDARGTYALGERLALEAGVLGRWQREPAEVAPSFAEVGVLLALTWSSATFRR